VRVLFPPLFSVRRATMHRALSWGDLALPRCARSAGGTPRSYSNAPIWLNFLLATYQYSWGDVLTDPSLPIKSAKVRTSLTLDVSNSERNSDDPRSDPLFNLAQKMHVAFHFLSEGVAGHGRRRAFTNRGRECRLQRNLSGNADRLLLARTRSVD
jgi:hypothetical protein